MTETDNMRLFIVERLSLDASVKTGILAWEHKKQAKIHVRKNIGLESKRVKKQV